MTAPRWDVSNVYPSLESPEFAAAFSTLQRQIADLNALAAAEWTADSGALDPVLLGAAIDRLNALYELSATLRAYIAAFVTTDSHNMVARRKESEYEQVSVGIRQIDTRFKSWIGQLGPALQAAIDQNATAQAHAFMLAETAEQARYLMSPAEESLAAELTLSGGSAWDKLQGTVTSQLTVEFELDGHVQKLPMPALINLQTHPSEDVRRRAHEAEVQAWVGVRETLAACLNGVKGETITLNQRRGRTDGLHSALDRARIDRPTLQAMLDAMQGSFPMFRRYFKAKARRLGKQQLAWWDIFAPTGSSNLSYSFERAQELIVANFAHFAPELANFATRAFDQHWIDAEQRAGKRGGGFCMELPAVKESRILCNFDGSLDQVSTIAHELGHAYHNECLYAAGKSELQSITPMTLAETASIMCEMLVMDAALAQVDDEQEELAMIETSLIGAAQVIVDIYSRFLFESELFERRAQAELSADELCEIMARAQQATYGDGLDEQHLHPYMWTWKPHYYSPNLTFYNFPYAFGLLFATGLYAIYQQRGAAFVPEFQQLLASTGEASAADLAARFGIDIRSRAFWEASLAVIERRIDRYCEIP
jgi:oligoendopeptidase F